MKRNRKSILTIQDFKGGGKMKKYDYVFQTIVILSNRVKAKNEEEGREIVYKMLRKQLKNKEIDYAPKRSDIKLIHLVDIIGGSDVIVD